MFKDLLKLRGTLDSKTVTILEIIGILLIVALWYLVTMGESPLVNTGILPKPYDVLQSFVELFNERELVKNTFRSLGYNLSGYIEAILIAVPVGFLLGLIPAVRGLFRQPIDALRYIPLPAAIGLFISMFGLGTGLKVHFLAFGIVIYLIPVVVQRINEVQSVYLKTVYTLGATSWQTIRTVYIPAVMSKLSDDIRVLTAISWTYIIIAESIGGEGGLGAMIWRIGQRQGRIDIVYALLIIIIIIGILQDKLFMRVDREFFPHKYVSKDKYRDKLDKKESIFSMIGNYIGSIALWIFIGIYSVIVLNEFTGVVSNQKVLDYLFGKTAWVISLLIFSIAAYKIYKIVKNRT